MTIKYDPKTMKFVDSTRKAKEMAPEELLDEAANISKRLIAFGQLPYYARYKGQRYYITNKGRIADEFDGGRFHGIFTDPLLPADVLKKMIANGSSRLNALENKVDKAYETSPEDALESTLESKDKAQVVHDLFSKRKGELSAMVSSIQLPERVTRLYLSFKIIIGGDNSKRFDITLDNYRGNQLRIYISQSTFRDMLAFINNFDEIKRQFKDMVSKILKGGGE